MKKKFLSLALALVMLLSLVACGGNNNTPADDNTTPDTPPVEDTTPDTPDEPVTSYTDVTHDDNEIYDMVLGEFTEAYAKALEAEDESERFALMAIAEAKLLQAGVFVPTTSKGGRYAISRVVPYCITPTLWGNDSDRFYRNIVLADGLLKDADRVAMKAHWNEIKDTATDEAEYLDWVRQYLADNGYETKDSYGIPYSDDPKTFDALATYRASDSEVLVNTYDGLLEYNIYGQQAPALAESYEVSDDGLTYTFHIREGVKWVDQQGTEIGEVTADDWVAGMEHLLDNADELGYLLSADGGCGLKGFDAYLQGEADLEDVGVKAVDKYTLEYTLEAPFPPFTTMLGYSIFAPLNREFYRSQGGTFGAEGEEYTAGNYGKTPSNIAYCGPYLITSYTAQNSVRYAANPSYWNADAVTIKNLVYSYNDGSDPLRNYNETKSGAISGGGLRAEALEVAKTEKPEGQDKTYLELYGYVSACDASTFPGWNNVYRNTWNNYDNDGVGVSVKRDNEAEIARTRDAMTNRHFLRAITYSIDRGAYNAQLVGEELKYTSIRNSYTPGTFQYLTAELTIDINGTSTTFPANTSYGEIMQAQLDADGAHIKVWDPNGDGGAGSGDGFDGWYNAANAKAELELAIAQLAQIGVEVSAENPIHLDYPVRTYDNSYKNAANVVKQSIEGALEGKVIIDLVDYDKSEDNEHATYRINDGRDANFDVAIASGWGPDYGDAQAYLDTVQAGGYMCKNFGLY